MNRQTMITFLGVLVSVVAAALLTAPESQAYELLGCKYNGTDPVVTYRFSSLVSPSREAATLSGADRWNATTVPGSFRLWAVGEPLRLQVTEGSYVDDFEARIIPKCVTDGVWPNNTTTLEWNTPSHSGLGGNAYALEGIAVHEMGHALGLAHTAGTTCGGTPSVMRTGMPYWTCGWGTWPFYDDRQGVRAIY